MKYVLPRGLIVSCQAVKGEPLHNCGIMHLMARCAKEGGAKAIRALCEDVAAIKKETGLAVIGLTKTIYNDSSVYITPTVADADKLIASGCEVIALDATDRLRPSGQTLEEIVAHIRKKASNVALLADISTYEEAVNAEKLGFEYVSTTLRGYTDSTKNAELPDFDFISKCSKGLKQSRLIVEGGIWETEQLARVLKYDPYAVIIGTAITRPKNITERFAQIFNYEKK